MAKKQAFEIGFTPKATEDLRWFRKFDQRAIEDAIEARLTHQPAEETLHCFRLRPNQLAEWELRVREFRVFYDIDEEHTRIIVRAVGYKRGNKVDIQGEEYQL